MIIRISSENRISLPKPLVSQYNLQRGDEFEIKFKDGDFILHPINKTISVECTDTNDYKDTNNNKDTNDYNIDIHNELEPLEQGTPIVNDTKLELNTIDVATIKLNDSSTFKPNLLAAQNYTKKYPTPCNLVIRTKKRYVEDFCNKCKGDMISEQDRYKYCPYCDEPKKNSIIAVQVPKETKFVVNSIVDNVKKLQKSVDSNISEIENEKDSINISTRDTVISPIAYKHKHQCYVCEQYYETGFIVDEAHFYCKSCISKDFKNFLNNRREK